MRRLFILVALLASVLSACVSNNANSNIISIAELTERENAILSTTSDKSFVFDFNIDSEYKEVSVWVEKYVSGQLVDDKISAITTQVEENGSIIFATTNTDASRKQYTINIAISGKGSMDSISQFETNPEDLDAMASSWNTFPEENYSIEGEGALASIIYSSDGHISSLSTDFYKDAGNHMNELEDYDVVYLLKAEFNK